MVHPFYHRRLSRLPSGHGERQWGHRQSPSGLTPHGQIVIGPVGAGALVTSIDPPTIPSQQLVTPQPPQSGHGSQTTLPSSWRSARIIPGQELSAQRQRISASGA
jgi:hypothetical protein